MGKVVIDISMSLDGYISGPNDNPDDGLGVNGDRLHDWYLDATDADRALIKKDEGNIGAVICGRRTYDNSLKYWTPGQGPHGLTPCVVVSHTVPEPPPGDDSPFTFVDDLEHARDLAVKAAGEKDVRVMGGADVPRQFLLAGLVEEMTLHLVPTLLGGGQRLVDNLGPDVRLELVETVASPKVTHLRYRVGN